MASKAAPPELTDTTVFEDWKKELRFWKIATRVEPSKQAATIFLSLKGKSREAVLELTEEVVGAADGSGFNALVEKLDSLWKEDENLEAFTAYENFEQFKRAPEANVKEYIVAFERLNNRLVATGTILPQGVLAYRLLKSASLTREQEQLAKATVGEFTYEAMCTKLKSIFGDMGKKHGNSAVQLTEIKQEEAFIAEEDAFFGRNPRRQGDWRQADSRGSRDYEPRGGRGGRGMYPKRVNFGSRQYEERSDQVVRGNVSGETRPRTNPIDYKTGQPSRCSICGSPYHWVRNCPEKAPRPKTPYFTAFARSSLQEVYASVLAGETFSGGILDCGCTKTVCGSEWYKDFVYNLSGDDKKLVTESGSNIPYKFGGDKVVHSKLAACIPVWVGDQKCMMEVEVVDLDLPMLISKQAMKSTGMILNFNSDTATLNGVEFKLDTTSSGHYLLPLTKKRSQLVGPEKPSAVKSVTKQQEALIAFDTSKKTGEEKKKAAKKLHRQFGHPSHKRLAELVKSAGNKDEGFMGALKEAADGCDTCTRYSRTNPRPVVGMSLAREFNDTIAMDLKQINGHQILHMIDLATRYSQALVVSNKRKETIVEAVIKGWVSTFGVPGRILSDNGGEFNNREMQDMAENLNTEVLTTAAESPWSNGICERHNAVIGGMVTKMMHDSSDDIDTALAWAINAKNSLHNVYGFSPAQLVFGRNPNIPTVLNDKLPALEGKTQSEVVAKNLQAKHEARKAFIECEASEKIRRALRHNTRDVTTQEYLPGEKVYYKRIDSAYWRGPAEVIGKDSHQVILKHGGLFVRTHPVSLKRVTEINQAGEVGSKEKTKPVGGKYSERSNVQQGKPQGRILESERKGHQIEEEDEEDEEEEEDSTLMSFEEGNQPDEQNRSIPTEDAGVHLLDEDLDELEVPDHESTGIEDRVIHEETTDDAQPQIDGMNTDEVTYTNAVPKLNMRIRFRDQGTLVPWQEGIVVNRAGKAKGVHRMWMNVKTIPQGDHKSVDFNAVEWSARTECALITDSSFHDTAMMKAMATELHNLMDNDVFEEIDDVGQEYIHTKWDFTEKSSRDETWVKARLVAKGFQEDTDDIRTDSPTCSKTNLRTVLAMAATNHWKVKSVDIKSAFLQGRQIEREVIVKPPKEAGRGKLWKLKKALYGLNDAAREWYLKVHEAMAEMGGARSTLDNAIFFWREGNELTGICSAHVDDFILCGTDSFLKNLVAQVKSRFKVSSECEGLFIYIGLQIKQDNETIVVSQESFANRLTQMGLINQDTSSQSPLTNEESRELKSLAGQLMWISSHTRPDLAYDVCDLSTSVKGATQSDASKANKAVRRLKSDCVQLVYGDIGDMRDAELVCYTDASYGNLKGGASQGGYVIFLRGANGNHSPICWRSRKLKRIAKSTMAAEGQSLSEGADEAFAIRGFVREVMGNEAKLPIIMRSDNYNLVQSVYSTNTIADKRLQMDISLLREMLEKKELKIVEWVPTERQLADCLTKKGASSRKLLQAFAGAWKL